MFEPGFFDLHLGPASLDVSVVIPVKDEAANVVRLAGEIEAVMSATRWSWECVWVDDGSSDETLPLIRRLAAADRNHRFVELERNYGQSAALAIAYVAGRSTLERRDCVGLLEF